MSLFKVLYCVFNIAPNVCFKVLHIWFVFPILNFHVINVRKEWFPCMDTLHEDSQAPRLSWRGLDERLATACRFPPAVCRAVALYLAAPFCALHLRGGGGF